MRVTDAAAEVNVSPKIGVDWYNFFRDIVLSTFSLILLQLVAQGRSWKSMSQSLVSICIER